MQPDRSRARGWLGRLALAALIMVVGMASWPLLGGSFSRLFQASATATLARLEYGAGGHTHFASARSPTAHDAQRDGSWDTQLELSIEGVEQVHAVSLSPRRLGYLPLLCFVALLVAAPLGARDKLRGLALGALLLWISALGAVWVTAVWLFARIPGLVYELSGWQSATLRLAYEGLVTSLGSKFIIPLLIAAGLTARLGQRMDRKA